MKFDLSTRCLMALCILSAPVLGGADGGCSGGEVAIGGDPGAAGSAGTGDPGTGGSGQATGGGPASGGSSSATGGSPAECLDEEAALRGFLAANKACTTDADCQMQQIGCGITEDGCTGTVYVNTGADLDTFNAQRASYYECMGTEPSCAVCERASAPPDCVAGSCRAGSFGGDICSLPFDVGPCDAAFRVWAFVDGSCQQRTWGGCDGNENRFNTLEECLAVCSPTTGECPPNRVQRAICIECGPAGGCARMIDACALLCQTDEECAESNLSCFDGVCQVGRCI